MKRVLTALAALSFAATSYANCEAEKANIVIDGIGNYAVTGEYVKVFKISAPDHSCISEAEEGVKCYMGGERITDDNPATYANYGSGTTLKIDGIEFNPCDKFSKRFEVVKYIGADEVASTGLGADALTVIAGDNPISL